MHLQAYGNTLLHKLIPRFVLSFMSVALLAQLCFTSQTLSSCASLMRNDMFMM